jgi:signal peptidase
VSRVSVNSVGSTGNRLAVRESLPTLSTTLSTTRSTWRSHLVTGLLLALGVSVLAIGVTIRVANLHLATVLSNSMQPTFSAGDLAVTQLVPTSSLEVGDVIVFVSPSDHRPLIHRISSLQDGVVTTRGDANSIDDQWHLTISGATTDRLVAVVPYVGWLTQLQRPVLLLAGVLVGLVILLELGKEVGKRLGKKRIQPQP